MITFGLIKKIRKIANEKKKLQLEKFLKEKEDFISWIKEPMSKEEIKNINTGIIINSAGWIGGDYTEKDIKIRSLSKNSHYFSEKEYEKLIEDIEKDIDRV